MAIPLTPNQIIAALDKWKVNYKEYPGWRTRGRPGTFSNINGIMVHHTGGGSDSASYLKFLFEVGRPTEGIPGPLCQFAVGATGVAHVGAAGRANHAGSGSSSTLQKVVDEDYSGYSSELTPGSDNIDGNARYLGIEVIYTGNAEMAPGQYATTVRLVAALVDAFGWSALSTLAHREHTKRKWDPGQTPMAKFRRDVRDLLAAGPGAPAPTEEEEIDMFPVRGDSGEAVEYWQRVLRKLGFYEGALDGVYGASTNAAVNAFRGSIGLSSITNTRISAYLAFRLHEAGLAGQKGDKGDKGDPGDPGRDGQNGKTPTAVQLSLVADVIATE